MPSSYSPFGRTTPALGYALPRRRGAELRCGAKQAHAGRSSVPS